MDADEESQVKWQAEDDIKGGRLDPHEVTTARQKEIQYLWDTPPKRKHEHDVKTTPQMTRFRDVKVCNNLVTDEIDDHRIQSDYKCTIGLQYPKGKNSTLGIAYAW